MDLGARVLLDRVDPQIASAYDPAGQTGGSRVTLQPLCRRSSGRLTIDTRTALLQLHHAVFTRRGDLRVTDGLRSVDVQAAARAKYEAWLAAGKPRTASAGFDPAKHKAAYVAKPGLSFHNAGRAVDVDIGSLRFADTADNDQLDILWSLAVPMGFRPAIRAPDERASEAWHFDFMGPWAPVFDRLGYEQSAMAAVLDVGGHLVFDHPAERELQAQLHRAGYDVGTIDGVVGPRTKGAASLATGQARFTDAASLLPAVRKLPNSRTVIWTG